MGSRALRMVMLCLVAAAVAGSAGCAADNQQQVSVVDATNASGSNSAATDDVDSENARRFEPVDAQPAPTPPPVPPVPPVPEAPPTLPTPGGAPVEPPPPPPSFGGVNECDVVFPNPAIMVWGVDEANADNGLWVHEAPSYDSPRIRLLSQNALTGFMTAGCQLGVDGTPWYEFGSSTGQLGYADSTFLRFSQLACLVGMVEARDPAGNITAIWSGPIEGHAYSDDGSLAAFIPNDRIGSGASYRLVPTESVIFVEPSEGAPCDLSDRQPQLEASRASRADRPPYRGDCATGPAAPFGPALRVDIDGVEPVDAVMLTALQSAGDAQFSTMTVLIGAEDSGQCSWRDVANLYSGPLDREDGGQNQHVWSCFANGSVRLAQYVFDADPANGTEVAMLTLVDGEMHVESSGTVNETIDTTSTCEISG